MNLENMSVEQLRLLVIRQEEALKEARAQAQVAAMELLVREAISIQRNRYGDGMMLHLDMIEWEGKASAALAAPQQHAQAAQITAEGNSPLPLTDEQIIGVLHSCGIDTYPSVNGFSSLQVSATSVVWVREVVRRCMAMIAKADSRVTGNTQAADEDRQEEAHKLAKILFGMVEGDGRVEGADIYAEGYSAPDGDVYVLRAAELLVEQSAESKELTRYVETFALQANALKNSTAPAQPIAGEQPHNSPNSPISMGELPPLPPYPYNDRLTDWWKLPEEEAFRTYGHQCRAAGFEEGRSSVLKGSHD